MKTIARLIIFLMCAALLYSTAMYGYVWMKMRPQTPIAPVSHIVSAAQRPQMRMLHRVNSVRRAKAKDGAYSAFELDVYRHGGKLLIAHDEKDLSSAPQPADIFCSVKNPGEKTWWLDVKTELSQQDIDVLKDHAARCGVKLRSMLFETECGPQALLLQKNGLPVLLSVPHGFDDDGGNPQKRIRLNAELEEQIRRCQPFALAGSFGKYPYLKAYFPHYNKAIYSATTVRPSLKKKFLADAILKDPSVLIWMQDEYTALPF